MIVVKYCDDIGLYLKRIVSGISLCLSKDSVDAIALEEDCLSAINVAVFTRFIECRRDTTYFENGEFLVLNLFGGVDSNIPIWKAGEISPINPGPRQIDISFNYERASLPPWALESFNTILSLIDINQDIFAFVENYFESLRGIDIVGVRIDLDLSNSPIERERVLSQIVQDPSFSLGNDVHVLLSCADQNTYFQFTKQSFLKFLPNPRFDTRLASSLPTKGQQLARSLAELFIFSKVARFYGYSGSHFLNFAWLLSQSSEAPVLITSENLSC